MAVRPQAAPRGRESGHGSKSDAARQRAILALLSERTLQAAAAQCRVGERTLRRWLADDASFQEAYQAARGAAFEAGINRIHTLASRAVSTLEDLLDAERHPSVRLGAARTILELGLHQRDADGILQRLADVEALQRRRVDGGAAGAARR